MVSGRPRSFTVKLSEEEHEALNSYARSRSLPHALARRAKIVVMAADGLSNSAIARKLDVSNPTVTNWCRRYIANRIAGLYDLPPGHRRRTYDDDEVARLMQKALTEQPEDATHWTVRLHARPSPRRVPFIGISRCLGSSPPSQPHVQTVDRSILRRKGARYCRFVLESTRYALVLCVDEKSQIQALERSQPVLPMGLSL